MKKFIVKSLIFFTITFVVLFILQSLLSLRVNNKTTTGHDNLELTKNVNSDLVFIGSSRCWAHFDPYFFQETFNLSSTNIGVEGHSELTMAHSRLLDYLKYNTAPKNIILNFDPFVSAGEFNGKHSNTVLKADFARFAFQPFNDDWKTVNHFEYDNWEKYFPLYSLFKYKQLINSIFQNNLSNYTEYGYERHDTEWDTLLIPVDDSAIKYFRLNKQALAVKNSLNSIDSICQSNGIKLICIQTPVYKSIYDTEIFNLPREICEELNISFIDMNEMSIRNDINNFYNSNHLNLNGVTSMNNFLKTNSKLNKLLRK